MMMTSYSPSEGVSTAVSDVAQGNCRDVLPSQRCMGMLYTCLVRIMVGAEQWLVDVLVGGAYCSATQCVLSVVLLQTLYSIIIRCIDRTCNNAIVWMLTVKEE